MADDWIKLRKSVLTHPKLVRTMSALKADRFRTLGGIMSAWCLIDEQTEDGRLEGFTPAIFDEMVGMPGIAQAMADAGWLVITAQGIEAPNFIEHNGQTAKRRAQDSVRKMSARKADKCPQPKRTDCGPEKRREEKRHTPLAPQGGNAGASPGEPARTAATDPDETWLAELAENPTYAGVDVRKELGKAQTWAKTNRRLCTRKFFVNWLNRADVAPMRANGEKTQSNLYPPRQHLTI